MSTERERVAGFGRLEDGLRQASDWYLWGPYVSERQWGTVREDYSPDGEAWGYLPHDHARSRAYRWGEDGLAGFCDVEQRLCLGLALWNGRDPILKERAFGLTGAEGNHGEDVKEYWWYLDAVPSHAWNRWRYHYPQLAFPYEDLRAENGQARQVTIPEYELLDTGVFDDDRYWITEVHYAKADPTDLLMVVTVTNAGPDTDTLHVLPTAWFRNTWSWDIGAPKPVMEAAGEASVRVEHPFLGTLEMLAGTAPDGTAPALLFCENETNLSRLFGADPVTPYPKDGINDHVIHGAATVNPDRRGTKCAFWYKLEVPAGATVQLRLRLRPQKAHAKGGRGARPAVRARHVRPARRGRRVLRRADAQTGQRRRGGRHAAGLFRHAVEQAALQLRRGPLAGRGPHPAAPAGRPPRRPQRPVAQLQLLRHPVHAGQVGVPMVRRLGPGLPLRGPGPPRPGVRQIPADPAVPGMVPAPERGAARLRVGLLRRQPAGAGVGGAGGVRHRRRPRPGLPEPHLRQAAGQLHLVGQPGGRGGQQPVRGRIPRARQHRPDRPLPPAGGRHAGAVGRHRLDGVLRDRHGRHRGGPEPQRPPAGQRPRHEVPGALRRHQRRDRRAGHLGRHRRPLLRPAAHAGRGRHPGEGPVDGRHDPHAGGRGPRRGAARPGGHASASISRTSSSARAWTTGRSCSSSACCAAIPASSGCC